MESTLEGLTPNTWPVGTEVVMLQVPWDSNYRDIIIWDSIEERNKYIDENTLAITERWTSKSFSYLKPNEPVRVPLPYSAAYKYNYIVVQNPMQPVVGEEEPLRLCYFITSMAYVNPQTTELTLQLDVIQTYQFDVRLGGMFVERSHMPMSERVFKGLDVDDITGNHLRKYLNMPEGLDVGSEYVMANHEWYPLTEPTSNELGSIIVISTADLAADPGSIDSPILNVADGQMADGLPSGCNVYSMDFQTFTMFLKKMKNKSWVAQCIQSISTYPARLLSKGEPVKLFGDSPTIYFLGNTDTLSATMEPYATTGNIFQQLSNGFPDAYRKYFKVYTYPYSVIELTAYNGNSVFIKPELVDGNTLSLMVIGCALAPFARTGVFVSNYGKPESGWVPDNHFTWVGFDNEKHEGTVMGGDFLDTCLWLADFPQFSIVNSSYITYLASTSHTRAYQYESAGWTNAKANAASDLTYAQAMNQAALSDAQRYQLNADLMPQAAQLYSGLTGTASNIYTQNNMPVLGAVEGAASYLADRLSGNMSYEAGQELTRQVAGQNLDYAKYAAQGDYANQIAGIDATVQDAALQAPSTAGQMGGQGFMWKQGLVGFAVNYKTMTGSSSWAVLNYWRRYGYKVQRFYDFNAQHMTALKVMTTWSYWKVHETYITCARANEAEKDAIRGILEKGVTVWARPEEMSRGAITDGNQPLFNIDY